MIEEIIAITKNGVMVNLDNVISIKSNDRITKYGFGNTAKHEIYNASYTFSYYRWNIPLHIF